MGLLEALILICFILWLTGNLTAHVFGGALHLLLLLAIILVIVRILQALTGRGSGPGI